MKIINLKNYIKKKKLIYKFLNHVKIDKLDKVK